MVPTLTPYHWVYLAFVLVVLIFMIKRRDPVVVCLLGILAVSWVASGSLVRAIRSTFDGVVFAGQDLFSTIAVISVIVAMSRVLNEIGAMERMIAPFRGFMRTPALAYFGSAVIMFVFSLFFWPSPATALVGAVLMPAAVAAGLPAIGFASAINLAGHGAALSGDFVIQGAPRITSSSAGIPVNDVIVASWPLVLVSGVTALIVGYILLRRDMAAGKITGVNLTGRLEVEKQEVVPGSEKASRTAAIVVPIAFLLDVVGMFVFDLRGGDATALVGGTAFVMMALFSFWALGDKALERFTQHLVEGFIFGIRVFGPVLPIYGFFVIGEVSPFKAIVGDFLPQGSLGIFGDFGAALAAAIPLNVVAAAIGQTVVGSITGLDGSGFSGLNLAGSTAKVFATATGRSLATLTAMGQLGGIWVGGGTLIPWAVLPVSGITGVSPMDLTRRNFLPTVAALAAATILTMFLA
ncbi:MAG: hypothetical protein QME87_02595 [Bacillota bacterium]|nr:hypothetical protein [Bacillota bacterium]